MAVGKGRGRSCNVIGDGSSWFLLSSYQASRIFGLDFGSVNISRFDVLNAAQPLLNYFRFLCKFQWRRFPCLGSGKRGRGGAASLLTRGSASLRPERSGGGAGFDYVF